MCSLLLPGSRLQAQTQHMEVQSCPKSPVFRTGSEPALSPTVPRKMAFESQAGEAIRGSDSQLCPKPPPKPSKVPSTRHPLSPFVAPVPPSKPQKHWPLTSQQSISPVSPDMSYCELSPCSPAEWERIRASNGYVERLKVEEKKIGNKSTKLDRSSYHHAIEALQNSSEEEDKEQEEEQRQVRHPWVKKAKSFQRPVFETVSAFRPGDAQFRLLPSENKPLEMSVLKRAKELVISQTPKTIAKHILQADCKVSLQNTLIDLQGAFPTTTCSGGIVLVIAILMQKGTSGNFPTTDNVPNDKAPIHTHNLNTIVQQ